MRNNYGVSPPGPGLGQSAVLDRWFAAVNAHDVERACELATPDVEIVPAPGLSLDPPGTTYRGREGIRTTLRNAFERFPRFRIDYSPVDVDHDNVTAELLFVLDDGASEPILHPARCHYSFKSGLISRIRTFDIGRHGGDESGCLMPRERDVLSLLAAGWKFPEIAEELGMSGLTVRMLVRAAKHRLHARTTSHAIALAIERGELTVEHDR